KIYDGIPDDINANVNHPIKDDLHLSFVWYIASTEEEKLSPSIFSNESKLSFTNHTSAYFKVEVKATHLSSGLETNKIVSDWVKVNIEKREITPKKISSPTITKIYDGSRAVNYTFSLNTDYVLEGALPNEEIDAKINSSYDSSNVDASSVTLIFESLLFGNNAISDNYSFKNSYYDLYFTASITPYVINLGNENFTKIYGDSDNLPKEILTGINEDKIDVEYTRVNGETVGKYAILGVEKLSNNANYLINFIGNSFLYIEKKTPTLVFPAFKDINYNPNNTLISLVVATEDIVFDDNVYKHSLGNFSWENASLIPSVNFTEGYSMLFTPNDLINYDFSSLDGYDSTTQTIKRKVILKVLPIDPTPTEIPESMEVALGRRFSSISLPSGWSIVEEVVSLSSIVNGSIGESQTFVGALVYDYDGTPNYNKIYSDLTIDCVLPNVTYSYGGQSVNSVNQTEVILTPNNEVSIKIKLENPFNKVGYLLSSWNIDGAIVPVSNNVSEGSIYELTEIIKNEISIAVTLKAREDIKVTFRHYYENLELSFNEVYDSLVERNDCVADSTYTISSIDLLEKDGFSFSHSTLNNSNESVDNFVISPLGDSVINLYYTRKNVSVNYVDDNYTSLNPTGSLPSCKVVKFGIPFIIDAPNNYNLQGYTFIGYTDGVTYEGEKLKLFKEGNYSVDTYVESITFSVHFSPVNTLIMDESLGLQNLSAIVGENIILPMEPANKPEGKRFAGWIINGVTYSAGAEFTMPAESVVLGVLWEDIESNEEDGGKVDLGVIIGASVGSTVGLAVIIAVTVILVKKSKRKGQIELVNNDVINNENSSNE
ncbi:MAG: hypothetical protein J6R44_01050, partial [Clostridia bacterium]|nr:hypothetical protein [Clostridia bacterium]